jgi:hypothetical protein|nr:MAG TPA: hypothetical protein [Caudoviricetes sp.]
MAMNKVYTRINWEDYPSENTDIDEINLNKMDSAIDALDNRIILQDALKVDKSSINGNIADWTMDETTGVITITKYNGEKIIFDLNIEKIPVGFSMSDDGIITMTTEDGTQFTADIGSMIPVLTFEDSATIAVSVTGTGKNKTYSFSIKTGSVTDDMLQPNYLADIRVESANASAYAQSANAKSVLAESYAIGGTGTREGEDTDNAKYYMEQAKQQTGGIPTKVSELENDAGYIKKDVNNLVNYYDKTTTDKKLANINLTDYLKKTGDSSNTTVTFNEPTELAQPTTGEKLGGIIGKVSLAIKNINTLITFLGKTDISSIGDGTVTGAISDVTGKLSNFENDSDLSLANCTSWGNTDNTITKIGNRVFITFGVQITDEQSSGSLIIGRIAKVYYPKTAYVRANAADSDGGNHMLYIDKSNGIIVLYVSTERYYSASFSYIAD